MDKNGIIREWFYRLPKGYAIAPYDKEELNVLHEVLAENKLSGKIFAKEVDQLDQAFLDAEEVEEVLSLGEEFIFNEDSIFEDTIEAEESDIPPTADELASILSSGERFAPKVLEKIAVLLNIDTISNEMVEKRFVELMGSDASHVDDILDMVMVPGTDQAKFAAYMENRTVSYKSFMGTPKGIVDTFAAATGLSSRSIERLATYKWPSMPAIGPLEVLLAILLKDGERPTSGQSGDLRVAGLPFEVKGFSARLKGQKGFGSARAVRNGFQAGYNNLLKELGIGDVSLSGGAKKSGAGIEVPKDQGAYSSGNWITTLETLNMSIVAQTDDDMLGADLAKAIATGFIGTYENATVNDFAWIESHINRDGSINRSGFIRRLAEFAFDYYIGVEDIKVFCVTNATTAKSGPSVSSAKILMFKPSQFPSYLGTNIGIVLPNYADSAGPQGVAFGLKLGTKTKALA